MTTKFSLTRNIPKAPNPAKTPDYKPAKPSVPPFAKPSTKPAAEAARELGRDTRKAQRAAGKVDNMPKANPFAAATKSSGAGRSAPKGSLPGKAGTGKSPLTKMFK